MSPEWFQLSFALGAPPSNGEESTTVGHGGDNKIEGYLHFWYQNDVGTIYLVGTAHGALRLLQDPEHTTAIASPQFEFEMDYRGKYQFTPSNVQDVADHSGILINQPRGASAPHNPSSSYQAAGRHI